MSLLHPRINLKNCWGSHTPEDTAVFQPKRERGNLVFLFFSLFLLLTLFYSLLLRITKSGKNVYLLR